MTQSPTPLEWAWMAGLFEGEGSITDRAKAAVICKVAMQDRDVVEHLHELWPCPSGPLPFVIKATGRTRWTWQITRHDKVVPFLEGILPFLGERRTARATDALARLRSNTGLGRGLATHCKRGHPFSGDNLYISPKGRRRCRACLRLQAKGSTSAVAVDAHEPQDE